MSAALKERIESDAFGRRVHFAAARELEVEGAAGRAVVYGVQWTEPGEDVSRGAPA